jgi:Flp pilus assembly protein TadG
MCKERKRGGAVVEFALLSPFLIGLIVGTMTIGIQLVKELELTQVARDTGSMYSRGVDFTISANQQVVARMGQELGWPDSGLTSSSSGVVYVSRIEYIDGNCNGITPPNGKTCNTNSWVFVNSSSFGNTTLRTSNFGAPPPCTPGCYASPYNGDLNLTDSLYNSQAVVQNFHYLGTPVSGNAGFQPGQIANLVEVAGTIGPWNGGKTGYAFAMF